VTGIEDGFLGLIERRVRPLGLAEVDGIVNLGGTILGTHNRANPFAYFGEDGADVSDRVISYLDELAIDAVVAIGGDGTMEIANKFAKRGVKVVGVPKTIDNDLAENDRSFGFDSAVAVVAESIARLETTAQSHGRVMIVETMGRYAGWIALEAGLAGGVDVILIPELPYDVDRVLAICREREKTFGYSIVCIAEGAKPRGGQMTVAARIEGSSEPIRLGGVAQVLQHQLQSQLQSEVRSTLLGHVQRGGSPTAFDRVLATRFGHQAAQRVLHGEFGCMVALQGDTVTSVPLDRVAGINRPVPANHALLDAALALGVSFGFSS
jgi:6-phosphofructokinase 1